jgi:hypothetical protein
MSDDSLTFLTAFAILIGNVFSAGLGGWRLGAKVFGFGLLTPWLIWLALVIGCLISEGPTDCRFVIGGGFVMVGVAGSIFWLACATPGLAVGLFGHWALRALSGPRES